MLTEEIKNLIDEKRKLHRQFLLSPIMSDKSLDLLQQLFVVGEKLDSAIKREQDSE